MSLKDELITKLLKELQSSARHSGEPVEARSGTEIDQTRIVLEVDERARAVAYLQHQAKRFAKQLNGRVQLQDGTFGFRLEAEQRVEFQLIEKGVPGEVESLIFKSTNVEVRIEEPVLDCDGCMRVDIEIIAMEMVADSKLVGGSEPIRMLAGKHADPAKRPTKGGFSIPMGMQFGSVPLRSTQEVFMAIVTDQGIIQNREPAILTSFITSIPPVGSAYKQEGEVPLYDQLGRVVALKRDSESRIVRVIS